MTEFTFTMNDLLSILGQTVILIPVLIFMGKMLKKTPKVKDWSIPYVLGVVGIALGIAIMVITEGYTPYNLLFGGIYGFIAAGMSVYVFNLYLQKFFKKEIDEKDGK